MSNLLWQSLQTADVPTWSVSLLSLASGTFTLSSVIDNTTALLTDAFFEINLGASVTAGSSAPSVPLWVLEAPDGTNFAGPSTASAPPPSLTSGTFTAVASASTPKIILIRDIIVRPVKFQLMFQNNLGVAFPSSGVTASLFRFGLQG